MLSPCFVVMLVVYHVGAGLSNRKRSVFVRWFYNFEISGHVSCTILICALLNPFDGDPFGRPHRDVRVFES